jgi:U3 small nucleolar ribonucleoprotein component
MKQTGSLQEENELEKSKEDLKRLFSRICYFLDALSNFHYTPKPVCFHLSHYFIITVMMH